MLLCLGTSHWANFRSSCLPLLRRNFRILLYRRLTLTMGSEAPSKRPFCQTCSKPARMCLCDRIEKPLMDNSISITILQHLREKNHPLNSTRIASLAFKNLSITTVSDVYFKAEFRVCPLKPVPDSDSGFVFSITHVSNCQRHLEEPNFDLFLATSQGKSAAENGFSVKKMQRKLLDNGVDYEELKEFDIVIPPGTVLLYPGKNAIEVGEFDATVKNLIVLDGTWGKANRMYHENPWLKLLPHLRLNPKQVSLYNEVRHQPKDGCLSTIESIVFALKALGDNNGCLDNLLGVFASMIGDQIRCKEERWKK